MSQYAGTALMWKSTPWTEAQDKWFWSGAGTATPREMELLKERGDLPPLTVQEYAELRGPVLMELDFRYALSKGAE